MKNCSIVFILFFTACVFQCRAEMDTLKSNNRYFRYNYDNDFFSATDRYYTQGVYIELILPVFKKTLLAKILIPLGKNAENNYGISFERQGFTPRSIRYQGIYYGERPFAGVSYLSHSLVSTNVEKVLRLTTKINTGIIGPNSKGAEEQKGIHYALNNIQPLGWENQVENDYVLNYEICIEKGLLNKKYFEFIGIADARIGTLYDDICLGAILRAGKMHSYFDDLGLTRQKEAAKFQWYVFVKGKLKAVGYNATMQGGMINRNSVYTIPSDDITRIVGTVYYGIVIAYKRLSLEYSKANISPEFRNGLSHGRGRIGVNVCF